MGIPDRTQQEAREVCVSLLARVRPKLQRILAHHRIPVQDAEDLLQDALLSLLTSWSSVRDPEAWLIGVLKVRCANYWRARKRRVYEFLDETLLEALAEPQAPDTVDLELAKDLGQAMSHLPQRCQSLFQLRYGLGCTPQETAARLGYCQSSISNIFSRCLNALTRRLVAVGFMGEQGRAERTP